jgi:hypothetical protein
VDHFEVHWWRSLSSREVAKGAPKRPREEGKKSRAKEKKRKDHVHASLAPKRHVILGLSNVWCQQG